MPWLSRLDWCGVEDDVVDDLVISGEMKCQPNDHCGHTNYSRSFLNFHDLRDDEESTSSDNDD